MDARALNRHTRETRNVKQLYYNQPPEGVFGWYKNRNELSSPVLHIFGCDLRSSLGTPPLRCQRWGQVRLSNPVCVLPQMKSTEVDQGLFTDSYCKVCSAQLISESQRVAHYEVRTPTRITSHHSSLSD